MHIQANLFKGMARKLSPIISYGLKSKEETASASKDYPFSETNH